MTGRPDDRPLADVTVLELGHIVAGPFCTLLLADLGAEVVKVEHPQGGDVVRDSTPLGNSSFNYVNRNKRSVTIDLKTEAGRAVFEDLLDGSDVLVENLGPGTPERLGLGYADLREDHPALVYCSIKGFGNGPYRDLPALDPVAEGLAGLMSVTGHPGGPPARSGTSVADMAASLYGALAVVSALRHRDRTGRGQHVSAPLFESTVSLMGYWLAYAQAYDDLPEPLGAGHPNWSPYDVFRTADDAWVFVGPSNQRQWRAMCEALDVSLDEDERFATLADRRANADRLDDALEEVFGAYDAATLVARLRAAGVPVAPVNDARAVCDDPHLAATAMLSPVRAAEGVEGEVRVPRSPIRSSVFDPVDAADPPSLGEDTVAVLRGLGYSDERIEALHEAGVV